MAQKVYGVVRVMNTITQGTAVAGLEAGSAVFCKEATEAAREHYPGCIIAVTNHHVVGEQSNVMLNFHFSQTPLPRLSFEGLSTIRPGIPACQPRQYLF